MKTKRYKNQRLILGISLVFSINVLMAKADGSETNNGDSHKTIPMEFMKQSPEFVLNNREFLDRFPSFTIFIKELSAANPYLASFFWNDLATATILTTDANLKLVPDSDGIIDEEAPDAGYGRRYEDFILFNVDSLSTLKPYHENPVENLTPEPAVGLVHESLHALIQASSPKEVHKMLVGSFNKSLFKNRLKWSEKLVGSLLSGLKDKLSKNYGSLGSVNTPKNALTLLLKMEAEQELRCLIYDLGNASLFNYGDYFDCHQWRKKWNEEALGYGLDKKADYRLVALYKKHPGLYQFKNLKYPDTTIEATTVTELCRFSSYKQSINAGSALYNIKNAISCDKDYGYFGDIHESSAARKARIIRENCQIYSKRNDLEADKTKTLELKKEIEDMPPQILSAEGPSSSSDEAMNWIIRLSIQDLYHAHETLNVEPSNPLKLVNSRLDDLNKELGQFDELAKYCISPSSSKKAPSVKKK